MNYGPDPAAVIDFVRSHAALMIRGNYDHALGFGAERGCSPRFRAMAEATWDYTTSVLSAADKQYLRGLPSCACRQVNGDVFFLCHATPRTFCTSIVLRGPRAGRIPKKLVPALILSWWANPSAVLACRRGANQSSLRKAWASPKWAIRARDTRFWRMDDLNCAHSNIQSINSLRKFFRCDCQVM